MGNAEIPLENDAIYYAARNGHAETFSRHLDHTDISATDRQGRTALHIAVASRQDQIFYQLINNRSINPDIPDEDGNTALMVAVRLGVNGKKLFSDTFRLIFLAFLSVAN